MSELTGRELDRAVAEMEGKKSGAIRVYFISDTGAAYADADTERQAAAATARFLRDWPSYHECTREEWQAKRRWQEREDRKIARANQ